MNSTTLYQFDVDDVSLGDAFAVLSQGGRRLLLKNLLAQDVEFLKFLSKNRRFHREQISEKMFSSLQASGLILDAPKTRTLAERFRRGVTISSNIVTRLARPLQPLFSPAGLLFIIVGQILLYMLPHVHLATALDFAHWATTVTLPNAVITLGIILLSMLIHEFGHATACLRMTGATGTIRIMNYRGTPAMAANVSSICLTDERGKAIVAVAGATFQSTFGVLVLALGPESARMGATMAILGGLFSLSPLPNTDGYWLVRDYFNLELKPRLWPAGAGSVWTDVAYGYALLAATAGFGYMLLRQCVYLFHKIAQSPVYLTIGNLAVGALLVYLFIVSNIFIWKNFKLFRNDGEGK